MKLLLVLFMSVPFLASAQDIDGRLKEYIRRFQLKSLNEPPKAKAEVFQLGRMLFMTRALAGNHNISCAECHHPMAMTHDRLPLGLGEGAKGIEAGQSTRAQADGKILARNTPALFNLFGMNIMFWDGRVAYDPITEKFRAPVALREDVARTLKSAVAVQAIFPIVDHAEMRGAPGTNPIADAKDEHEAWDLVVKKLLKMPPFQRAFAAAYPGEKINIGHVGEALAEFQTRAFYFSNTPYDRYLKGDVQALTSKQKKGMELFFTKAQCGLCHNGPQLGGREFHNVGAPQIGPGKENGDDLGRFLVNPRGALYGFRTVPLRNVAVTAPYFHTGAYTTLEEVLNHYEEPEAGVRNYKLMAEWKNYNSPLSDHDHDTDEMRISSLSPKLSRKLGLTEEEKSALLEFLSSALTDDRLKGN